MCGLLALIALLGGCSSGGGTSTSTSAQTSASTRLVALTVTPINGTVTVHTPLQMKAAGTFTDSTTQDLSSLVTWSASSPTVSISASGVATGAHQGTATVTATLGDVSGSTALAVGPPPAFSGSWIERGPKPMYMANQLVGNVSGRVTAALPMGLTTLLIGTASGGVWRTTDSGATWTPTTDDQPCLAIGSLARDPHHPDVVLAGTGEGNIFGSRAGVGILRSTDAGKTWALMPGSGIFARMSVAKVAFDPDDPTSRRIFVATTVGAFGGFAQAYGLYRSVNGGETFEKLSTGAAGRLPLNEMVTDLAFQPGNAQVMLATVLADSADDGVWRSTDGGDTWSKTTVASASFGRICLAAAPQIVAPQPAKFYALVGSSDLDGFEGVFGSDDSGATWRKLFDVNTGSTLGGGKDINLVVQSGYNQAIAVDLYTSSTIYIAGNEMCRVDGINIPNASYTSATRLTEGFWDAFGTVNGGLAGSPHPDHHALVFDASANLLSCSDGGLYSLPNASVVGNFPSAVWTNLNGSDTTGFHNLACMQMSGISLDPTNTFAWAGFQDNGNAFSNGSLRWVMPSSGDGGIPLIEPTDPNRQWLVYNAQPPLLSTDNGVNFSAFGSGTVYDASESSPFPVLALAHVVEGGGTRVATARQSVYEAAPGAVDYVNASGGPLVPNTSFIRVLAYAPADPGTLYAGSNDGQVFVRTKAGGPFSNASNGLPGTALTKPRISGLAVDPIDSSTAWATVQALDVGHVFKTTDAGAHWTDVSGNLPNVPATCVAALSLKNTTFHDDSIVFVGTEAGVYCSQDGGSTWTIAGSGLPLAPDSMFDVNLAMNVLTVATYGRGAWQISLDPATPLAPRTSKSTSGPPTVPSLPFFFPFPAWP